MIIFCEDYKGRNYKRMLNNTTDGCLVLTGCGDDDLGELRKMWTVKVLDFSYSEISSFEKMPELPNVERVIGAGSRISSAKGMFSIRSAFNVDFSNTPLSKTLNYKLRLCVLFGKRLTVIDGKLVPAGIRKKAMEFPEIAADLINAGWEICYPCPCNDEIQKLADKFLNCGSPNTKSEEEFYFKIDINEVLRNKKETKSYSSLPSTIEKQAFTDKLIDTIRSKGYDIDKENTIDSILGLLRLKLENRNLNVSRKTLQP